MIPILTANTVSDQLLHHQHQNFQRAAPVAVLPLPERVGSPGAPSLTGRVFAWRARLRLSSPSRHPAASSFTSTPHCCYRSPVVGQPSSTACPPSLRRPRASGGMADALASGASVLRDVGVQVPLRPPPRAVQLKAVHEVRLRKCSLTFCRSVCSTHPSSVASPAGGCCRADGPSSSVIRSSPRVAHSISELLRAIMPS